jgi:hypothetical protein
VLYLGVHKLESGMTEKDVEEGFEKYKASAREAGLNPISAVVSMEKGFAYCQTEGDSAQKVREAHESVEIPIEDVVEVKKLN